MMNRLHRLRQVADQPVIADTPEEAKRWRAVAFPAVFAGLLVLSACGGGEREYLPVGGATLAPQDPSQVVACDANQDGVITLAEKAAC